jgi:glucokinase
MIPVVAVDLGGTHLRAALFLADRPQPDRQVRLETNAQEGPDSVIERIVQAVTSILPADRRGLKVAIGAPGPLDPEAGTIIHAPNLPGWLNMPLRQRLEAQLNCRVVLGNDANLAALGEWKHGAGRGTQNMIYLTISTGIGGGVIADGRLLLGKRGMAAELGHMIVVPGGEMCGCGHRGHLEAEAAGPAIARKALRRIQAGEASSLGTPTSLPESLTAAQVGAAAEAGDALSLAVIQEAGELIGRHLANLTCAFSPEVFVFGGGVSNLGDKLLDPARRVLNAEVLDPLYLDHLRLVLAELGDDAGLIGAMVLARQA